MKHLNVVKIYEYHFYFLLGLILVLGHTENINAQDFCTTDTYSNNSSFEPDIQNANAEGPYYLKIYVHVIRNSMGIGGQNDQDVQDAIDILHQDFNPHDIFFIWDCQIDYIDDDTWFIGPANNEIGIFSVNNNYDGIDVYLFPAIANSQGGKANGVMKWDMSLTYGIRIMAVRMAELGKTQTVQTVQLPEILYVIHLPTRT